MKASRNLPWQLISSTRLRTQTSILPALRPAFYPSSKPTKAFRYLATSPHSARQQNDDVPTQRIRRIKSDNFPTPSDFYELTFSCKPCQHRSTHRISKHGYHKGTVVVACPMCKVRHVISDHLQIFLDEPTDLEGIMAAHGEKIKKGFLGKGGEGEDIEFWDDGTETQRGVKGEEK